MPKPPACLECRESPTGRCRRHRAPLPPELELPDVVGGQFYYHTREEGFVPIGAAPPREPDIWVCRRVADYPGQRVPAGGAVAPCTKCQASVVFNPQREVNAPKICMQCARIRPLPFES